jgi:hypothetical protein
MEMVQEHLAALVAAGMSAFVLWLRGWALDLWRRRILESALGRAAGLALADPEVRRGAERAMDIAVERGVTYLRHTVPDTLTALGVGATLADMLRGEIGRRLVEMPPLSPAAVTVTDAIRIPSTPVLFDSEG